jgi:hypothetical protein
MVDYRGFTIVPKRDFIGAGFFIDGRYVKRGYVVTRDGCNAVPGAAWFITIEDARKAVDVLIDGGGERAEKQP